MFTLQIKTKPFTSLEREAEETIQAAEGNLAEYIIALQGYFRKQENDYTSYFAKHLKELSKIKPVNLDNLVGDERPENKKLKDFVDNYNWRKQEDDLLTILKYIHQGTIFFGVTNAITFINKTAEIKEKKQKVDISEVVEYANSPRFAVDAQEYIRSNYDDFLVGAKEISKNIDSQTSALIYDELYKGVENLESMDDLAVRVADVFDGCSQDRALMIARTETMRSFNSSTIDAYKTAQIKEAQILITEDERTCDICRSFSGLIVSVDEAKGLLPLHPKCRCTSISVIGEPLLECPDFNPFEREHIGSMSVDKTSQLLIKDAKKIGVNLTTKQANEIVVAVQKFSETNYPEIRKYLAEGKSGLLEYLKGREYIADTIIKQADLLEKYIKYAPKFTKNEVIYRGIKDGRNVYVNLPKGSIIDMRGTSSWTSDQRVALKFSNTKGVIFKVNKNIPNKSASINHFSSVLFEEEVLLSKDLQYKLIDSNIEEFQGLERLVIILKEAY